MYWKVDPLRFTTDNHKLHTLEWDEICRPKCVGELGIRCIEDMNAAFLAIQGWKILTQSKTYGCVLLKQNIKY